MRSTKSRAVRSTNNMRRARAPFWPGHRDAFAKAKRPLRVLLAQPRGFCAGVVRAVEIVDRALEKYGSPVYVRHEIVHNRSVVEHLERKGARFVEDLSEVPEGAVTIFSAHGVSRAVVTDADERGLPVIDATCPLVAKVHAQGRCYVAKGRTLILIGHAGHPEVEGTMGQIDGEVYLVSRVEDVATLDIAAEHPVAYITQTTLSVDDTREIINALSRRFHDIAGPDTNDICYATQNRQTAVRKLSEISDILIVGGASNSSNSNRLREIGSESGIPSYLVADGNEIEPGWLAGVDTVGITAGASAPEELVLAIVDKLRSLKPVEIVHMDGIEEGIEFRLPAELAKD